MYQKLQFDTLYREKVRELLASGFKIGASGKLEPASPRGVLHTPWVFTNYDARRKFCSWWNGIYCGKFNVIPTFCRFNCWKTVIYPRNVLELLQLADILRSLGLPSKCGADRRNYTYSAWGGYVYGDTLEEGRAYHSTVREVISVALSPDVRVILKRGCTEMERLVPSDKWDDHSEDERNLERQLDDLFLFHEHEFRQSAWNVRDIKEGWLLRAIEIADPSVEAALARYGNGMRLSDLTVKSITYHEEEEKDGSKHDETD